MIKNQNFMKLKTQNIIDNSKIMQRLAWFSTGWERKVEGE
jgi:hypothetical protein